jgi:hypothetical protein
MTRCSSLPANMVPSFRLLYCLPTSGKPSNVLWDTFPDQGNRQFFFWDSFMEKYWGRKNETEVLWQNIEAVKTKGQFYGRILGPQKRKDGFMAEY